MAKDFKLPVKDNDVIGSINSFLRDILEKKMVHAVLVPQEMPSGDNVVQTLVRDPKMLEKANPLCPVMGVHSSRIISRMTKHTPNTREVAVVLKSCELRALIELVKLKQASIENLIVIGIDCFGTFPLEHYKNMISQGISPAREVLKIAKGEREDSDLRTACQVCEHFIPRGADIVIGLIGTDLQKEILIRANSKEGERILSGLNSEGYGGTEIKDKRDDAISRFLAKRTKKRDALFEEAKKEIGSPDKLLSFFSACIKCHNCMGVCPICYCRECLFESPTFDFEPEKYMRWAERKGSIKMPTDTLLFHLTRMNHMLLSCVGCGVCEEACPNDIPLFKVFRTLGHNVQQIFKYVPGNDPEEEPPLSTFKEDELKDVGE